MSRKNIIYVCLLGVLIAVDLLSKYFLINIHEGIINGIINYQWAWSLPIPTSIVIILGVTILVAIYASYRYKYISLSVCLLLIAGWIWNITDRVVYWWVRDRIDLWFFPVFNLADIYITVWICLVLYQEYKKLIWKI